MNPDALNFQYFFDEFFASIKNNAFSFARGSNTDYNAGPPIFDYSDLDEEQRAHAPNGVDVLLDAGFAAGYEVIPISEQELREMPEEEWILLQRLISEPVSYPNTQISCSNVAAGNVVLTILHHVPCVTTLGA